jgi:hypothetical protein
LREKGVDIVAFDKTVSKDAWTSVLEGGAEKLSDEKIAKGKSLFLCYPDEEEPLALECLENFQGDFVIHVGELISTGQLSGPQAPWGRTSSADFQVQLAEEFHCVLVADLPRFPFRFAKSDIPLSITST